MKNDIITMTAQVVQQMQRYPVIGTKPWNYETAAKDLAYQVGSLTKCIMQLQGERYAHGLSPEEIKQNIGNELADILSEVLFIAHELNIDIQESWDGMLEGDERKFLQYKGPQISEPHSS